MLDNTKVGSVYGETAEHEWPPLSKLESHLIKLYRRLSEQERQQVQRFTEVIAENPAEGSGS